MKDIISELGPLAIGSRLKRLSDMVMRGGEEVYRSYEIDFKPKWFPLFYLLSSQEEPLGIMEISERLNISHPAVIQLAKDLEKKGLVSSKKCKKDARKRLLQVTKKGQMLLPKLQPIWADIKELNRQLIEAQTTNLLQALQEMETIFLSKTYAERMKEFKQKRNQEQ